MAPDLPYIDTARPTFPVSHCPVRVGQHFHTYIYDARSRCGIFGAATMYKRTPTRVPLDGTEATLVDTSWPVNKDHKISNPAAPIGRARSRGRGARRPIGRPPRGCEDVLNDAPQCTWLTKANFPRGSLGPGEIADRSPSIRRSTVGPRRDPRDRRRASVNARAHALVVHARGAPRAP